MVYCKPPFGGPEQVYAALDGEFPSTTVEAYVVELLRWRAAEEYLANDGPVLYLRDDKGTLKGAIPAPQLKVAKDASVRVEKLAATLRLRKHVA